MGFFQQMIYRFQRFMIGRYAVLDSYTKFLLAVYLILGVLTVFLRTPVLRLVNSALLVYILFRMLSKNIPARRREEQKFLEIFNSVTGKLKLWDMIRKDKNNKYFICPQCKSTLRIPKLASHKTIELHCTKCGHYFIKKV